MTNQEARFILGAYRPDGRDASDPMFAKALGQATRDPDLRVWLEREQKLDTIITTKIRGISPPPELRAAILAGARASLPRRHRWNAPLWFMAAAAVLVLGGTVAAWNLRIGPSDVGQLAQFALKDMAGAHDDHVGYPPELAGIQLQLSTSRNPLTASTTAIDLDDLRRRNCRTVRLAGREVFEICFERNGTWFHLYAARRSPSNPVPGQSKPVLSSRGEYTVAAWADSNTVYALVGTDAQALRRLI